MAEFYSEEGGIGLAGIWTKSYIFRKFENDTKILLVKLTVSQDFYLLIYFRLTNRSGPLIDMLISIMASI